MGVSILFAVLYAALIIFCYISYIKIDKRKIKTDFSNYSVFWAFMFPIESKNRRNSCNLKVGYFILNYSNNPVRYLLSGLTFTTSLPR